MNLPRRAAHRIIWMVLLVVLPVLVIMAVKGRVTIEPMEQVPALETGE